MYITYIQYVYLINQLSFFPSLNLQFLNLLVNDLNIIILYCFFLEFMMVFLLEIWSNF